MKKLTEAYLTVEAALIIPIVLGIFIFLIYIMFYQYDRCLTEQDMGILSLRGAVRKSENNEELFGYIQKESNAIYLDKYVAAVWEPTLIKIKQNRIEITGKALVKVPFPRLALLTGQKDWSVSGSFQNRKISPVAFVRACRRLRNLH